MKTSKYKLPALSLLIFFLFSLSACQKDFINPKESVKASAQKDGIPWVAYVNIRANKKDVSESIISLVATKEDLITTEIISFVGAQINEEMYAGLSYELAPGISAENIESGQAAVSYRQEYGDLVSGNFDLTPCISSDSYLTITSIDGKKVSGVFSICILRNSGDVIEFTNGAFKGKIDWL